jgi:5-formyltetrahydrofolate cyclo-ligase
VNPIAAAKAAMRAELAARRSAFDPQAGDALAAQVLRGVALQPGAIVAGVWPLPGEMDLRPLMRALHARGHPIVLPETPPRGRPLVFRSWTPGCDMVAERFGTQSPTGAVATPDVVFVPLLAFDRAGFRLGYGGGYYDRTLPTLPGRLAIGFGYAAQEVERVPTEPHDRRLDMIATERGILHINDMARHFTPPAAGGP